MDKTDSAAFGATVRALGAAFNREVSEDLLMAYWLGLRDLPLDQVQDAAAKAIQIRGRFMPTPGELREIAGVIGPDTRAMKAFEAVKTAVAKVGVYRSVDFDDPITNAVIRSLGGWPRICDTAPGDDFDKWLRKDFERYYAEYCRKGVNADEAQPVRGLHARDAQAGMGLVEAPVTVAVGLPAVPVRGRRESIGPEAAGAVQGLVRELANGKGK